MNSFGRILLSTVLVALATAARADAPAVKCVTPEEHRQQFQRDIALLERYPSEDDLQEARYRALGNPIKQVNRANEQLKELIAKARDFAEKAKFFEAPHRMPDDLRRDWDLNRELEQIEFQHIADAAHDIQRINDRYDGELKRYRELVNGTAKTPCVLKNE